MKIVPLAIDLLNGTVQSRLTGMTMTAKTLAVIGVLATISVIFFLVAITILLAEEIGAFYACLTMGAVFAVAAVFILMQHHRSRRRQRLESAQRAALSAAGEAPATAVVLAEAFLKGFLSGKP